MLWFSYALIDQGFKKSLLVTTEKANPLRVGFGFFSIREKSIA